LLAERPDDAILGEEGTNRAGTSGIRWVIDPLDGTTNYLYRHPSFSVSIAAEPDNSTMTAEDAGRAAVVGVVVDIASGDRFRAVKGQGATHNGQPITVSSEIELARALVATGFGYDADRRRGQAAILARIIGDIRDIRRMGSAALDLCSMACGHVDAYYELGLAPWDLAAGALIASEAGADITYLPGSVLGPATLVAAPPALSAGLIALLQES
jgi:myo-inositol-1(or 4)-monophosphatase